MNFFFKKLIIYSLLILFISIYKGNAQNISIHTSNEPAILWGEMTLNILYRYPNNSPTYCSRALAYMGLAMYESVIKGSSEYKTLVGQIPNLPELQDVEPNKVYKFELALNASQARLLKNLYDIVDSSKNAKIDSLEAVILKQYGEGVSSDIIYRSVEYGKTIASQIFEWSKTDGGYQAYLYNFDKSYIVPSGNGKWVIPIGGQSASFHPLHPSWGNVRNFVSENNKLKIPKLLKYSEQKRSKYYKYFEEVFIKSQDLTQKEKEIAAWWADDPSITFSPPGHSYNLANQIIKNENPDLYKAAYTYAKVGLAVADAFINCWKAKYMYFGERPSKYIKKNIYQNFTQYWPEPPFPAFYSGHSVQSAATAKVLESIYGYSYSFTDKTHLNRNHDVLRNIDFPERKYNSIWETAIEAANSRFFGGIHTQYDNLVGLEEGKKIAKNINKLNWTK